MTAWVRCTIIPEGGEHAEILMPKGSEWNPERSELWNKVEEKNKRQDAQVAREVVVALPDELSAEERKRLALDFGQEIADRYQLGVDVAVHAPNREGDKRNHHAHILMTTNCIEGRGLGNKARELDKVAQQRAQGGDEERNEVEYLRERWGVLINERLKKFQAPGRVDHRSFERQGCEQAPGVHLGPEATAMERRGEKTERGNLNRLAETFNRQFKVARAYLVEITQKLRGRAEAMKREAAEKVVSLLDKRNKYREALAGSEDLDALWQERKIQRELERRRELRKQKQKLVKRKSRSRDWRFES